MSSDQPILDLNQPSVVPPAYPSKKRQLLIVCAATLVPGLGQLLLGKWRKACLLLALMGFIVVMYWPVRLPLFWGGIIGLLWSCLGLLVFSGFDVILSNNKPPEKLSKWWLLVVLPLTAFGVFAYSNLFLRMSGFGYFIMPSASMENTLRVNDRLIADLHYYRFRRPELNDLILFKNGQFWSLKRVVAVGGNVIEGRDGNVFVDGKKLDEPFTKHIADPDPQMDNFASVKVADGKFFVLGDNRDISYDSRQPEVGLIDIKNIVGKPLYLVRPLSRGGMKLR